MSTAQSSAPAIRNAGTTPKVPRKLFVNIPVSDLQRSIAFFEALDFTFNPQFTSPASAAMLVGEDAVFMLLTHERFLDFSKLPIGDPHKTTNALFSISVDSREGVDDLVKRAFAAGGTRADDPEDHGFMYDWSFYDLDGYGWGVFWMDPNFVPK
jgi:predicted lactoylglutathione lyase